MLVVRDRRCLAAVGQDSGMPVGCLVKRSLVYQHMSSKEFAVLNRGLIGSASADLPFLSRTAGDHRSVIRVFHKAEP